MREWVGVFTVFLLVAANGFFVAAEFSLVAVRRSRVVELVALGRVNARALLRTVDRLDASLAATQLGITLSSLALGWVGEPAIAHLIKPWFDGWAGKYAGVGADVIAVAIAFGVITALHIVLGELAPKSLALQRSEGTALWVVRPLNLFLFIFRPAIVVLNGLGNLVLRAVGLRPGASEETLHSAEELKLLVSASQEAGLLLRTQQEVVERVFNIGDRRIGDIMTPRTDLVWIDIEKSPEEILRLLRDCRHEHIPVGRGDLDELLGVITKRDLLDQYLDNYELDLQAVLRTPLSIQESMSIFKVLERFRTTPISIAVVRNEYGGLEGMVTQADLLEAMVGHLPDSEEDLPDIVEREDGSLLIDGACPIFQMSERLGWRQLPDRNTYHTAAGFVLAKLAHIPRVGEYFDYDGWRLEVIDTDGRRIDKLLAMRLD